MASGKLVFTSHAHKDARKLVTSGLKDKAQTLLDVLAGNPFQNPPPYEKLVGDLAGVYSRRINIQHRLVYQVLEAEKTVKVRRMWSPYEKDEAKAPPPALKTNQTAGEGACATKPACTRKGTSPICQVSKTGQLMLAMTLASRAFIIIPVIMATPVMVTALMFIIFSISRNVDLVIPCVPYEVDRNAACIISTAVS